ncbi:hypothetical protein TCDM_13673 [Trypanosoma cruzi Dm28c]|uniref:Uncharacterized protein n=1 Tax=Trypanosoma cruzi Dm28c TaxID=1416333 RepID=V5AI24_TRYCR|nr:hypothetical protein TCDM_13673 [Trypanosoma cruzi Dm28c]
MTDGEAEGEREMDAVRRHLRSTWPVSMRSLRAGTQEGRVRGKKARSSTNTQKKQTTGGKSTATALALAGNSTPALTHTQTPSQCRQSAREKNRPSTQQTQIPPAPPVQSHGNGIRPQPRCRHTTHAEQKITKRATRGSGSSPSHDAASHSKRSHGTHCFHNRRKWTMH